MLLSFSVLVWWFTNAPFASDWNCTMWMKLSLYPFSVQYVFMWNVKRNRIFYFFINFAHRNLYSTKLFHTMSVMCKRKHGAEIIGNRLIRLFIREWTVCVCAFFLSLLLISIASNMWCTHILVERADWTFTSKYRIIQCVFDCFTRKISWMSNTSSNQHLKYVQFHFILLSM